MKKSQLLLKLILVVLHRVLSKWHRWLSLIQFSALYVSNSTLPHALSFSFGKFILDKAISFTTFQTVQRVISFLGKHTRNNINGPGKYSEVHIFFLINQ